MNNLLWLGQHVTMIGIKEKEQCCGNCRYFRQHYLYDRKYGYFPLSAGHCTYPRVKRRGALDRCEHFEVKEQDSE